MLQFKTINDAHHQLVRMCCEDENVYIQKIQKGSFEGEQERRQFPAMAFTIEYPWLDTIPIIPVHLGLPQPCTEESVQDYFANYLMDPQLAENETYKYASRIHEVVSGIDKDKDQYVLRTQLEVVIDMLKNTPMTNQACIEIAKPSDVVTCVGNDGKLDPPCLRLIDFKVVPIDRIETGEATINDPSPVKLSLEVSVYFRSWDLWAGLPTNLGGIELLKQYVAGECGLENGRMHCYSAGLHLYKYQEEIANLRVGMK